jgi:hypothetical protein
LVHIETQTPNAVSAVNFNNVFTSAYRNYRIQVSVATSGVAGLEFRLRASGTDNSSSNYQFGRYLVGGQISVTAASQNNTTGTFIGFLSCNGDLTGGFLDVFHPQVTGKTSVISIATGRTLEIITTNLTVTNSYDGFTIYAGSNFSGSISVYGYKD